jgi:hypothetical protein
MRVELRDHYENRRRRVERLVSTCSQRSGGVAEVVCEP